MSQTIQQLASFYLGLMGTTNTLSPTVKKPTGEVPTYQRKSGVVDIGLSMASSEENIRSILSKCKEFLKARLSEVVGEPGGMPLYCDMPNNNPITLCVERRGALREYYSVPTDGRERFAYALGSGTGTVGFDKRQYSVKQMPECFINLSTIAAQRLRDRCDLSMKQCPGFNSMELKVYYGPTLMDHSVNFLNLHCDYEGRGNDSQADGTVVFTQSFGDPRELTYRLQYRGWDPETELPFGRSQDISESDETIDLSENVSSLLHPADEEWRNTTINGKHFQTRLRHGSNGAKRSDISVAVIFRTLNHNSLRDFHQDDRLVLNQDEVEWLGTKHSGFTRPMRGIPPEASFAEAFDIKWSQLSVPWLNSKGKELQQKVVKSLNKSNNW